MRTDYYLHHRLCRRRTQQPGKSYVVHRENETCLPIKWGKSMVVVRETELCEYEDKWTRFQEDVLTDALQKTKSSKWEWFT